MTDERKYKQPVTSVQKMRAMRAINGTRHLILLSAQQEEELDLTTPDGQHDFVHHHRSLQSELAGHFSFIDVRDGAYASDIASALARDITHYILTGDTPGTQRR